MQLSSSRKKILGVFALAMINVIAIDSLRNLPINAEYGFSIVFMYIIGGLFFLLPCCLVTAELATRLPKTGGSYQWVREAFGPRWGFVNTWLLWIYNVIWFPTILSFIAASIAYLIDPALAANKLFMVCVILVAFFSATWFNARGMKSASWLSIVGALVGTIVPMAVVIALAIGWISSGKPMAISFSAHNFFPHLDHLKDLAFLVVIIFSLIGIEMSAVHAGDVKNPKRDFPRALLISSIIIIISEMLGSLAVAICVPKSQINIVSGLDQGFQSFLSAFHLQFLMPVVVILIVVGGFAGMAAWVLGPAKSLMVAAEDGCAPAWFAKTNKHGAPIAVLSLQAIIVVLLCFLFVGFKSISTSYWILSDLTAQLALLYYIVLFAAAIKLRYGNALDADGFIIPGKKHSGMWLAAGAGIVFAVITILLGFMPPSNINVGHVWRYELTLIIGIVIFALPPLLIYCFSRKNSE